MHKCRECRDAQERPVGELLLFWQKDISPAASQLRRGTFFCPHRWNDFVEHFPPATLWLWRVTFCGAKKSPKSALPSLVRYADTLTLQSVRGFADATSLYRGERSSSLTRPLRGLILTALQSSAATEGMEAMVIVLVLNCTLFS